MMSMVSSCDLKFLINMKQKLCKVLFLSIFVLIVNSAEDENCRFNEYNFRSLEKFPWNVVIFNGSDRVEYLISLCQPLSSSVPECSQNTSVCQLSSLKNVSLGVFNTSFQMSEDVARRELTLALESQDKCPDDGFNRKMRTFIIFKCGKTLGMPVFVSSYACDTYFEWHTTAACKSSARINEIKCYLYDTNGQLRDLGPLVKTSGSYQVEADDDDDSSNGEMYINICRDISQASGCQNSSACLFQNSSSIPLGSIESDTRLQFDQDGNLFLTYKSTATPAGCTSTPSTKVTLRCPHRGMGDMPRLISSLECQYHVEWATEYACPSVALVSHTCELHQPENNLAIDLRSLGTDQVVSIQVHESGLPKYNYSLNICSQNLSVGSEAACGQQTAAACQSDFSGKVWSLGLLEKQTLRYSDHQLSLTYEGGDPCSSGFQRKTIINFHCNESAGRGFVEFFGEDSCTYMFEWSTELACIASPALCHLSANGGAKYDLSRLIRISGINNWRATDTETSETIILNVCNSLSASDHVAVGCPAGAAICLLKNDSTSLSLGKFQISPKFDDLTQSISLTYTDGDTCGTRGSKYSANITFKCSPGAAENEPTLLQKTSDGCHYELVWFTASACPLAHLSGNNCLVEDSLAGYSFDLNPLSKPATVPGSYYNVTNEYTEHSYFLNVCGPVTGTVCSGENVGICQVDNKDQRNYHSAGQASRTLHYYNGVLKLVYDNGDAYHRDPPVARKTEIEFLCDTEAGIGKPRFESEANFTYSIEWMTSYACPPMFVDCSFVDLKTKNRYDLSPLSRKDANGNWVLDIKSGNGFGRKLYINVCRPVVGLSLLSSDACAANAGVCQTEYSENQEKVKVANYGRSLTGPRLSLDGKIFLEYTNGDVCDQDNATSHYSTKIVFICNKDITTMGPSINEFNHGCNQTLIWETAFACPEDSHGVTATGEDQCSIRDPITGHLYDLQTLHADKSYTVNNTGRIFKLNICGPAADCGNDSVTVCDDRGNHLGFSSNSSVRLSNDLVELLYLGPDTVNGRRKVTLTFTCNDLLQQNSPKITFIKEEATSLLFDVETPLACLSYAMDCQAFDRMGNKYDLTPLMKLNDNWVVEDQRHNRYYINICRPINSVNSTACPGGAAGGCQVTSTGEIFNMGYVQGHLIAPQLNSVTMQYQNGDICHNGTDKESRRSTRITFYCSGRHESPIFVKEEDDCSYVFDWLTPFACPIQHVIGENCVVRDPLYQVPFDLRGLTKAGDDDYVVYDDSRRKFTLNVCGALRSHRNDSCGVDAGACVGQGDSAMSLGRYSSRLEYEDGELKLFYNDGKESCNGKWNRTATIMFSCDHSEHGASGLSYLEEKSSDCSHWFEWQTSVACLPFSQAECSIADDKGNVFNFERLMMSDDNYEIDGSDAPNGPAKFIINVCTTLVHTKGALCPPNSAACMIKVNETDPKKRYVSIGRLNRTVLGFEDGRLVLSYDGGAQCSSTQQNTKTVIQFDCAPDVLVGRPEYVATDVASCVHHFVWSTRAACVLNTTAAAAVSGNCSVQDPYTGHIYSLSVLRNDVEPYIVSSSQFDHSYSLNVCGPLINSPCGENSGSCQIERLGQNRSFNAGLANSLVLYEGSGLLKLIYSNGTMCHHVTKPRMTSIAFICAVGAGNGKPQFIGEDRDGCSYFFSWHTDLACDREIRCVAHSDEHEQDFDLSQLSAENTEYTVAPGNATGASSGAFFLSVCRPLSPMYKKFCPPGSAVCREETEGKYVSLGSFNSGPVYDPVAKAVVLEYSNGSRCAGESSLLWKTKISFFCRPGQPENLPKLVGVDENLCEYKFEWITSAVCPSAPSIEVTNITDCVVKDAGQKNVYNFSALMSSMGRYIQVPSKVYPGHRYNITLCGAFPSGVCASSAVCRVNDTSQVTAYGNSRSLMSVFELPDVKLSYRYGDRCLNDYTSAVFLMECNQLAPRDSKPMVFTEEECFVMFKWPTPFACLPEVKSCKFRYDSQWVIDLSKYSLKTSSWKLNDTSGNRYFLNLCHGINDGPSGCGNDMAVCQTRVDGSLRLLGNVDSQWFTKSSGAENSLTIEYSHHFDKISCGARIEIVCGLENEEPRFKQSVDDCSVEFEWKMNLMCGVTRNLTLTPATENPKTHFDSSNSRRQEPGNAGSQAVVITISVLASVVLVLVLILVFRNPSRRAVFAGKLKSCFSHRKRSLSSLQYTALSDRDLNEGDGLLSRNSGNIQHYDSDDDLML